MLTDVADAGAGVAEHHHGGAVVVVHQGPEVGAGAGHGPLRHDVLPRVRVTLHNIALIVCTTQKYTYYRLLTSTKTALI